MKKKDINALTLSIFLLYPLYASVGIARSMLAGEKMGFILFSLSMGILGYLLIPYDTMDLTRHYENFNAIRLLSLSEVIVNGGSHLFLNIVMWVLNTLGFPKEIVPLISVTLGYYLRLILLLYVIQDYRLTSGSLSNRSFILIFTFILLSKISFMSAASGLRSDLAVAVSLYGIYIIFSRKENSLGFALLLLSGFIHPSTIILIPLVFIAKIKEIDRLIKVLFWLSLLVIVTGSSNLIFFFFMDVMKPYMIDLGIYHPAYFDRDGVFGAGYWETKNIKVLILEKYIKPLPFYVSAVYLLVVNKTVSPDYRRLLYLLFLLVAIVSISRVLFGRYSYFTVLLFTIMLMIEFRLQPLTKFKKLFLSIFICSLLMVNFGATYQFRDVYIPSWYKLLFMPLPFLFLEAVEPNEYIIKHGAGA